MAMRMSYVVLAALGASAVLAGYQKQLSSAAQVQQLRSLYNVKALTAALNAYAEDADGIYPYAPNQKTLKVVTLPYVKEKALWKSENRGSEMRFNTALGGVLRSSIADAKGTPMFFESKAWADDARAVSFVDGSGSILSAHDWAQKAMMLIRKDNKRVALPLADLSKQWKD